MRLHCAAVNQPAHLLPCRFALLASAALVASLGAAACEQPPPPSGGTTSAKPTGSAAAPAAAPVTVTILYTADEDGSLIADKQDQARQRGGVAELLGAWVTNEGHCTGAPGTAKPCSSPKTLALSGGDSFTGPAVSTLFSGEPMAEAMNKIGYAAAALGNHDLDFGRLQFVKNKGLSKMAYVGANVKATDPEMSDLNMPAFTLVERQGAKIGVIGLASPTTATRSMADRFRGLEFGAVEDALSKAVPEAWKAGADALVVIAHECPDKLAPVLKSHADWKISFVGGANCHQGLEDRSTGTIMIAPDGKLRQYARAVLTIDRSKPQKERVTKVEAKAIDVGGAAPEPSLATFVADWKKKVDTALGEEIGHTEKGLDAAAAAANLVTRAWREQLGADVAIVNAKGVDAVAAGPITKATVYSMMPYDNSLMLVEITGADLQKALENKAAIASGVTGEGKTAKINGKPIDPAAKYKVATVEYLYFGGDGFEFEKQDPEPTETGMDWRTPVLEWLGKQKSTKADPLEKKLK